MIGRIKFWNSEKQFGFVVTEDGREFYVGSGNFTRPFFEGARVQFEQKAEGSKAYWAGLSEGKFRDKDGINHRNPRRPRPGCVRPLAVRVVVIEEKL